jgi:hypothetical protein
MEVDVITEMLIQQTIYGTRDASSAPSEDQDKATTQSPISNSSTTQSPTLSSSSTTTRAPATPPTANTNGSTTTINPDTPPDLCKNSQIDAITALADGRVYAFRGQYAYQIDPNGGGILPKYTEKTSYVFYGLPGKVDAAVTYKGKTYFFVVSGMGCVHRLLIITDFTFN